MIINIILILIIIFIITYLYYKYKYQFWSRQPVFHFHNLKYWCFPPGIIQHDKPKINKFYNSEIQYNDFSKLKTEKKALFINFIQSHYLTDKNEKYNPTGNSIIPYFQHHNDKSFIALYMQTINSTNRMLAAMTLRPLTCHLNNNKFELHYVDYLCVHKKKRKQGIAQQIIYSTYVNHRNIHKNVVYLFKREGENTLIVPLTIYKTYAFDMKYWKCDIDTDKPNIKVVMINDSNLGLIIDMLESINNKFKCVIKSNIANIKALLATKNIYIGVLFINNEPTSMYMFRNTYTSYNGENSLELFASYNNSTLNSNEKLFTLCALIVIDKIRNFSPIRYLFIENISNNNIIIKNILERYSSYHQSVYSYYFYNFGVRPLLSSDVFVCL